MNTSLLVLSSYRPSGSCCVALINRPRAGLDISHQALYPWTQPVQMFPLKVVLQSARTALWPAVSLRVARCLRPAAPTGTSNCGTSTSTSCTLTRTPMTWESPAAASHLSLKSVSSERLSQCFHYSFVPYRCAVRCDFMLHNNNNYWKYCELDWFFKKMENYIKNRKCVQILISFISKICYFWIWLIFFTTI